ncbi:MAG: lysophospholipid acyltransferase family protein [Planctomycetota bacterium]
MAAECLRLLSCTWRYEVHRLAAFDAARSTGLRPVVMLLHGRLACVVPFFGRPDRRPNAAVISRSRDGDLIAAVLERFGFGAVRGSAHRGGARALIEAVRHLRAHPHVPMAFTVDGSRGPRGHCKAGALLPAQRLQAPIFLVAAAPRRAWVAPSWDRFCLPVPWTRIAVCVVGPVRVPTGIDEQAFEHWRQRIETLLLRAHRRCANRVGYHDRSALRAVAGER